MADRLVLPFLTLAGSTQVVGFFLTGAAFRSRKKMGLLFSCSVDDYDPLSDNFQPMLMRTLSFGDDVKTTMRSSSFNGRDAEPVIFKASASGRLIIHGSLSFKRKEADSLCVETTISVTSPKAAEKETSTARPHNLTMSRFSPLGKRGLELPELSPDSPKHEAALKLQKVYKSFRTRRQLADCAVLVEQRWWKLLDFALLKRSSVSFFDIEKPESAVSKWSRARTRAAKVGKGLMKDDKAQKLALQHWLEAIDPRHRYGHNLHYYYDCWLHCESKQPFFYWLDVGEGKEVNLEEHCPRSKLQQQCIKYLGPKEREAYEVIVEDGMFVYKTSQQLLGTSAGPGDGKWIFVLSTSKNLYVGQKKKGTFQHSSFLAGGATSAAGRLVVENGILKAVWPHSGHYRPTEENFQEFMSFLKENKVDLTDVKLSPMEGDDKLWDVLQSSRSELDLTKQEGTSGSSQASGKVEIHPACCSIEPKQVNRTPSVLSSSTAAFCKRNLFEEEHKDGEEPSVPRELILHRIHSKKGMKSYQLGKQLSFKWTTGAGPRIGCVRDYPLELQYRALEQVNLSPTSAGPSRFSSPREISSPILKTTEASVQTARLDQQS